MKMKTTSKLWEERRNAGASDAGYHFYNSYLECPRMFYIKQLQGIQSHSTSRFLIFGKILHDAIELFFNGYTPERVYEFAEHALEQSKHLYPDEQIKHFEADLLRMVPMLRCWYRERYSLIKMDYTLVEAEKTHTLRIQGGYILTGRIDFLLKHKETGTLTIVDTKSTSGNINTPWTAASQSDQLWLYCAMIMQDYQIDYIPEVYINSIAGKYTRTNGVETDTGWLGPLVIHQTEIDQVLKMHQGLIEEVSWKVAALTDEKSPIDHHLLFPRRTTRCASFSGCEYQSICRKNLTKQRIDPIFYRSPPLDMIDEEAANETAALKKPRVKAALKSHNGSKE